MSLQEYFNYNINLTTSANLIINSTNSNLVAVNITTGTARISTNLTVGTSIFIPSNNSGYISGNSKFYDDGEMHLNTAAGVMHLDVGGVGSAVYLTNNILNVSRGLQATNNSNTIGTSLFTTGGNVGIGLINPSYRLDVSGTTRFLSTASNSADTIMGNMLIRTYARSLTTTTNDFTNICILGSPQGALTIHLDIVKSESGDSISKSYIIPVQYPSNSNYYRCNPISSTGPYSGNDFALEIQVNGSNTTLRLVRVTGSQTPNYFCTLRIFQSANNPVTITDSTSTGTGSTNSGIYAGTPLTQVNNQVGINTTSPSFTLDITGTTRITGTLTSGSHLISSGSLFIQNKISSLGYQYNVNTTNGNNITTDTRVINKRIKSSRANAVSAVTNWTRRLMAGSGPWAGIIWSPELGLFAAVLATTSTSAIQTSPDGIVWTTRTTPNLAYTGPIIWISELGIFVAGTSTNLNAIVTSTNGITWTAQTTPTTAGATAYAISWSPELYQITMTLGGTYILYSQNGTTWNTTTIAGTSILVHCWSSELNLFIGAQYANGTFGFAYSSNGITWTSTTALNSTNWLGICYSPELGISVAVSQTGTTNNVAVSRDGINWTLTTGVTGSPLLSNIIWAPEISLFVICQQGGGVWISPDGYTWTNRLATTNTSASAWSPELSIFCVVTNGNNSAFTSNINEVTPQNTGLNVGTLEIQNKISSLGYQYNVSSTNGNPITTDLRVINKRIKSSRANAVSAVSTWNLRSSNLACQGIAWSPELGLFAATNYNGATTTTNAIQTSPDGIVWTTRTTPSIATLSHIKWSSELTLFVATSYQAGTSSIITSPDAVTWTSRTTPAFTGNGWLGLCYSPELGLFAAVLGSSTANTSWIMTSSNGTTWTGQTTPSSSGFNDICWATELNLFVACSAVTSVNCIATSPNGTVWTLQTTPNIGIYDVKWSAELGLLVGITIGTSCITSPDGITWTSRTVPNGTWNQLVWCQELSIFAACQTTLGTNAIMTSHDGINWVTRTTPSTQLWGMCWSPELSIFVGVNPLNTSLITSNYGLPENQNTISAVRSQMTVTSSGNVGISTTAPSSKLHVVMGDATSAGSPLVWDSTYSVFGQSGLSGGGVGIGYHSNSGGILVSLSPTVAWRPMSYRGLNHQFVIAGTVGTPPTMIIASSGNVGIQTTSPIQQLDVSGNGYISNQMFLGNSTTGSARLNIRDTSNQLIQFQFSTSTVGSITCSGPNPGLFLNGGGGSSHLCLVSTGNVGINTTAPTQALDVNGTIARSGVRLPRFDNGTFTSSTQVNIPILFSDSTYNYVEIKVSYFPSTITNVIIGGGSGSFLITTKETITKFDQSPTTTAIGLISQNAEIQSFRVTANIQVSRENVNGRHYFMSESAYCLTNVGATRISGMGLLLINPLTNVTLTPSSGNLTGSWSTVHSY